MADQQNNITGNSMASRIATEGLVCISNMPVLSDQDIKELKNILRGKTAIDGVIDLKQVIALLANSDPTKETAEIIGQVLSNNKNTVKLRVSAAENLAVVGIKESEKVLLENLEADDDFIRQSVISALAKIGSEHSLKALDKYAAKASINLKNQVDSARTIIAFREGKFKDKEIPNISWQSGSMEKLKAKQVADLAQNIWGSSYGIDLNDEIGFEFKCGQSCMRLLLNATLKSGEYLHSLKSSSMVAGLILQQEHEVSRYSVRYVVMTRPSEKGISIIVNNPMGEVAYYGEATPDKKDRFSLNVRDVGVTRVPIIIQGKLADDEIKIEFMSWHGVVKAKKHGLAV